jgi:hypothetical protein
LGIRAAKGQSERGTGGFPPLGFYPLGDAERQVWLQRWRPIDTSTSPHRLYRPTRRHVHGPRAVTRTSDYWIQLETTPQPFGGRRWWFICPRTGVRAAKLYLPNGAFTFASRQTYRLVYHSQREAPHDRALRRAFKLRGKLGAEGGIGDYVPKPKWMRWPTYDRKLEEIYAAEKVVDAHLLGFVQKLECRSRR